MQAQDDYVQATAQVGLVLSKISGVGTNFGLLVHVLPGPNKRFVLKPSIVAKKLASLGRSSTRFHLDKAWVR